MPEKNDGVTVAMRMRPFGEDHEGYVQIIDPGMLILSKPGTEEMYQFNYTHAMMNVQNEHVYECVGRPLVDSVLDGFNCTMLAYGQTGSGKTFTMLGPEGRLSELPEKLRGVMPRALEQLFSTLGDLSRYSEWKMEMTYIEVYCEVIRDLLSKEQKQVDVKDMNGVMGLKNVTPSPVKSMEDAENLIERAQNARQVSATDMNSRSSRSHTILTIWLNFRDMQGTGFSSKLNLVDLAGSERRKAIGDKGAKTNREGDAINKSLLTLQTVVMALGQKGQTPSYRSSKLTLFLKDSIGGNCKTTLITCAYGDPSKIQETLATCRFAENMMKVVVTASKNKGGGMSGYGNKVKLDPTVMAIMEKRVADQVAIERAKLIAQFQKQGISAAASAAASSSAGGAGGEGAAADMSAGERKELERLRQRFEALDNNTQKLSDVHAVAPGVEDEMNRLRKELDEAQKLAEAAREAEKAQAAEVERQRAVVAEAEKVNKLRTNVSSYSSNGSPRIKSHMRRSSVMASQELVDPNDLDDTVAAFMKLRQLQPRQAAMQARLDGGDDDEELEIELEFLNEEVQHLIDYLQQHGCLPDMGTRVANPTGPMAGPFDDDDDELITDDDEDPVEGGSGALFSRPPRPPGGGRSSSFSRTHSANYELPSVVTQGWL